MSEGTADSSKVSSLEQKGCIKQIETERAVNSDRLFLPSEIEGVIPIKPEGGQPALDEMDFFKPIENRVRILEREEHRCFYCLKAINKKNHVIEHVVSRP